MTNRELIDEILTLVRSESNNNPAPLNCKIIRNYQDNPNLVDVKLEEGEIIQFVSVVGSNRIGNKAVLVFIDGASDNMLVISPSSSIEIDDELSNTSENAVENKVITTELDNKVSTSELIDLIYPIGAIYISANAVNPSVLFGGEWEPVEDRFLLASGNTYIPSYDSQGFANKTGGASSVTLTANQSGLRAHGHGMAHTHRHRHQVGGKEWSTGSGSEYGRITTANRTLGNKYTDYNEQASSKSTTDNNTSSSATEAHDNMPPYLVVNIWIRVQ